MRLVFIAVVGLCVGCTADNPLFGASGPASASEGSSGGVDGSAGSEASGPASVTDTAVETTSAEGSSGVAEGSTGAPACELGGAASVGVVAKLGGQAQTFCEPLLITGVVTPVNEGRWTVGNCGCDVPTCETIYELELQVPAVLLPDMPACARIEIVGHAEGNLACGFGAIRVHDGGVTPEPATDAPLWVASHGRTYADGAIQPGLLVAEELHEPCRCAMAGCCAGDPGSYKLIFYTGDPADEQVALFEGEERIGADGIPLAPFALNLRWDVAALSAHVPTLCDARPAFDWVIRAQPGG